LAAGTEVASLIALDQSDWLVATPDGLFDGTPAAWGQILWRFSPALYDLMPVEIFFNEFYYPGLLTDIFNGKRPRAARDILQKDRRQPEVSLASQPLPGPEASLGRNVTVKVTVTEKARDSAGAAGSGAQDVRLFRNGSMVKVWRGDVLGGRKSVTLEATVALIAGENVFTAYAFNHDNIKSGDATLALTGSDALKRQGTAHVLAVGVNKYSNPQYDLRYAVADAASFGEEVKRGQQGLGQFRAVEVITLLDAQATKANILSALRRSPRTPSSSTSPGTARPGRAPSTSCPTTSATRAAATRSTGRAWRRSSHTASPTGSWNAS
jgi:hypothetical protein